MIQPRTPNMVFVSHANPEDNDFARWLALQLAKEGYPVWCDLTRLLGREKFWEDIQDAISNRTVKFLFALSRPSNAKSGTLDELNCALGVEKKFKLKDFVITLKMDDLPYDDVYINIQRRNHIDFRSSWASGFSQILKKLVDENVPKDPRFNPDTVSSWWRSQNEFSAEHGMLHRGDEHLSNWFPIGGLPRTSIAILSLATVSGKSSLMLRPFRGLPPPTATFHSSHSQKQSTSWANSHLTTSLLPTESAPMSDVPPTRIA